MFWKRTFFKIKWLSVLEVIVQAHKLGVKTRQPLYLNIIKVLSHHWRTTISPLAHLHRTTGPPPEHHRCIVVADFLPTTLISTSTGIVIVPSQTISVIPTKFLVLALILIASSSLGFWSRPLASVMHRSWHVFQRCRFAMPQQLWRHQREWIGISAFPCHRHGIGRAPSCPQSPIHKADGGVLSAVFFS